MWTVLWIIHQLLLNNFDSYGHLNLLDSRVSHEMEVLILYSLLCIPIRSTAARTCCTSSLPSDKLLTVRTKWYSEANWTILHDKLQFLLLLPEQTVQLSHCMCQTNKYFTTKSVLQFMTVWTACSTSFLIIKICCTAPSSAVFFFFGWLVHFKEGNVQTTTNWSGLVCGQTFTKEIPIHTETAGLNLGRPLPGGWTTLKGRLLTC